MKTWLAIKPTEHGEMVEVWDEIEMLAGVYGTEDGIKLMSRYNIQVAQEVREGVNILEITVMRPE